MVFAERLLHLLGDLLVVPFGHDRFRGDAVDPDAVGAGLRCGVFGEEFDAGFGGGVGDWGAWVWAVRGGRGDGDDVSVSSLLHPGEEALDRQERRGQVGIDSCAPGLFGYLLERGGPAWAAAGVRDQDVDRAVDVFDLFAHRFDFSVVGEGGDEGADLATCRFDLAADELNGVRVAAVHDDACSFGCEECRDGGTDASRTAGHKGHTVLKAGHASLLTFAGWSTVCRP